jgi:hypothetical protein
MRAFLLCLALVACGGDHEAADAPLSDSELLSEIMAEAERINSCDVVGDCEAKSLGCSALYVNADADQTRLDELLADYQSRRGPVGCPVSCQCGLLRCEQNKCVTQASDCMEMPPDAMTVCL